MQRGKEFDGMVVKEMPQLFQYACYLSKSADVAEDLLSDTVVTILSSAQRFEQGTNFNAWATVIMRNQFVDTMRKKQRRKTEVNSDLVDLNMTAVPPSQDTTILAKQAIKAMMKVEPKKRAVLLLVAGDESYDDIASRLSIPVGSVKSRLNRGRTKLGKIMA